jgi:hypothetical protein
MAPALPGIPHWDFFLVSFHFSLIIVYHTSEGTGQSQKISQGQPVRASMAVIADFDVQKKKKGG